MAKKIKCSFDKCRNLCTSPATGLCKAHYNQQWKGNELKPLKKEPFHGTTAERIALYTKIDKKTGCWLWQGAKDQDGYGIMSGFGNGEIQRAHRASYEETYGVLTEGAVVHHKCAVKSCLNPEHLQAVTHQENIAEMFERNYYKKRIKELEALARRCERKHKNV